MGGRENVCFRFCRFMAAIFCIDFNALQSESDSVIADSCCSPCSTVPPVNIPGTPGVTGPAGTNGADGVPAWTVLTAQSPALPAVGNSISLSVANNSWMTVGQIIVVAGPANFQVVSKTGLTVVTGTFLAYKGDLTAGNTLANGASVSPAGVGFPALVAPTSTLITDNSTGAAGLTVAAGVGVQNLSFFVNLADLANADLLTTYPLLYKFKILSVSFGVEKAATTAAKLATLTPKISGVAVTGGVLALTSANCTPTGNVVAGSAVTAANTGASGATISITGSAVTAFIEGAGWIIITVQNMDTTDGFASLISKLNAVITAI